MSIRLLARDLYRAQREVERLEWALKDAPIDRFAAMEDELRLARGELNRLRRIMAGQKDAPSPGGGRP